MSVSTSPQKGVVVEVSGIGLYVPRGQVLLKITTGSSGDLDKNKWENGTKVIASFDCQRAYEFAEAMKDEAIAAGAKGPCVPQAKTVSIGHPKLPCCMAIHGKQYLYFRTLTGGVLKPVNDFACIHPGENSNECFVLFWSDDGDKDSWLVQHSTEEVLKCVDEATARAQK